MCNPVNPNQLKNSFFSISDQILQKKCTEQSAAASFEHSKKWVPCSRRQFAMRFLAAHIDNSSLEGSAPESSVAYWSVLIHLWLSGEGILLPFEIENSTLVELVQVLKIYVSYMQFMLIAADAQEIASKWLQHIKENLALNGYTYIGLGYKEGPLNQGHAIPLRVDRNTKTGKITVHFLNLGEGIHLHPQLVWDAHCVRYHFRSFPITFSEDAFFGEKGIDLFSRQVTLMSKSAPVQAPIYSAYDVYGAFFTMGLGSGQFTTPLSPRSKKPQVGSTCGDQAIELIIRDFFIEKGIEKTAIQRFFCNEKLCTLLNFSHVIENSTIKDDWIMLKKALQQFSMTVLKKKEKCLQKDELPVCEEIIDYLLSLVIRGEQNSETTPIDPLQIIHYESDELLFALIEELPFKQQLLKNPKWSIKTPNNLPSFQKIIPLPFELCNWLDKLYYAVLLVLEGAHLEEGAQPYKDRSFYLLLDVFSSLPLPEASSLNYWDEIPEKDIPSILNTLCQLAHKGIPYSNGLQDCLPFYKRSILLHTFYSIADKLMRRIHTELKGFYPPFILLTGFNGLTKDTLQFPLLPNGNESNRWRKICCYFSTLANCHKNILFAFHSLNLEFDLIKGLKLLSDMPETDDPVVSHLKFLAQFLNKNPELTYFKAAKRYALLWENRDFKYLPKEFHDYQYLAQMCWHLYTMSAEPLLHSPDAPLWKLKKEMIVTSTRPFFNHRNNQRFAIQAVNKISSYSGATLLDKLDAQTENAAMCLEPTKQKTPHKKTLSLEVQRGWARIKIHPHLQITSTLQWVLDHLFLMREDQIKDQVEKKLFSCDGQLIQKIKHFPPIVKRLRQFIEDGFHYFSNVQDREEFVFFIRLGVAIEMHIEAAGSQSDPLALKKYESLLLEKISAEKEKKHLFTLYTHLRLLYSFKLPSQHSLKEMLKSRFWLEYNQYLYRYKNSDGYPEHTHPNWVLQETYYLEDKWEKNLSQAATDCTWAHETCHEIFVLLFPRITVSQTNWTGSYPEYAFKEYTFNIRECVVVRNNTERLWPFDPYFFYSAHLYHLPKEIEEQLERCDYRMWIGEEGYDTYDGSYRFAIEEKNSSSPIALTLQKKIYTQNGSSWYRKAEQSHALFQALTGKGGNLWQQMDQDATYVIMDSELDIPCYIVQKKENCLQVNKLDARGNILPYTLLNLEKKSLHFFQRLGFEEKEVLCWINREKQIASLEISPLGLTFEGELYKGKWVLRSIQYADFTLCEEPLTDIMVSFNGALILENVYGEKKVIIAAHALERNNSDFTTHITLGKTKLGNLCYFQYTLDSARGLLINDDPEANLFLAILFAAMRDFPHALLYLEHARTYHYCFDMLEYFSLLNDQSPEALAFYLRVGNFIFHNHTQLIYSGFGTQGSQMKKKYFYQWLATTMTNYLRQASQPFNSIPAYIRLTAEEELYFLTHLEKKLEILPYILKVRKEIVTFKKVLHKKEPTIYPLLPKPIAALPDVNLNQIFSSHCFLEKQTNPNLFNPAFVRTDFAEIMSNFPTLFARAQEGKGILDAYYLVRSCQDPGSQESEEISAYAYVLYLVSAFPEEFKTYSFCNNLKVDEKTFVSIVKKASFLQKKLNAPETKELPKSTLCFDYTAQKILEINLPPVFSLKWEFPKNVGEDLLVFHHSLQSNFLEKWVQIQKKPAIQNSRPIFLEHILTQMKRSAIFDGIVQTFKEGYFACLHQHTQDAFIFKKGTQEECLLDAKNLLESKKNQRCSLRVQAEELANGIPSNLVSMRLRQTGRDLPQITMDGILTDTLEAENPNILKAANPSLSCETIQTILIMTMRYHILNCHIHQLTKGIAILTAKEEVQVFGEALAVYGAFDPTQNPELLLFQSKTKMIARKEQAEFVRWLKNALLEHRQHKLLLFEFEAGGGKGTFFTPILKKMARKDNLLPVSVSLPSLYPVERKKQKVALKKAYHLNMEVLEIALNTQSTAKDFMWIYEQLSAYSQSDTLKIVPEVYYALDLKYQLALENRNISEVSYLSLILHLFKEQSAVLIDEGRLNLSPLTQAKIGIGKKYPLPSSDHALFICIYKALIYPHHTLHDGRKVCAVVQLMQNKQAMMSNTDREKVRLYLIQYLSTQLQIPKKEQPGIQNWWINATHPKPSWLLKQISNKTETAHLIMTAGEYFHRLYAFAMQSVGRMRHLPSMIPGEEIEVPAYRCKPSHAYFEEPYVALILTIHGTLQRGLNLKQTEKLIALLQETYEKERITSQESITAAKFNKWLSPEDLSLANISSKNSMHIKKMHSALHKQPEAIFWYLKKEILGQIHYSCQQLMVTPQHFLHGFQTTMVYSAVLGPTESYGSYPPEALKEKLVKTNAAFAAHVLHELTDARNQKIVLIDAFDTTLMFIQHLWANDPLLFRDLHMLIDVGGMLRDFSQEDIASAFFDFMKGHPMGYDGIVFFQDTNCAENENDLLIWFRGKDKPQILPEGDIMTGLLSLGYRWEDLNLLTLIGPSHATGGDIKQHKQAKALLLVGENLSLGDLIQGVMRLRGFLKEQSIIWGVLKTVNAQIEEELQTACTPETLLYWTLSNEEITQQKEILMSAYQQIDYLVQQPAREALKNQLNRPEEQITLWKKHREGFIKLFVNNPLIRFGHNETLAETTKVLMRYAQNEYARYKYKVEWKQATRIHQELNQVIQCVHKKIKQIPERPYQDLGKQTQLYCHQQQQLQVEQEKVSYIDLNPEILPPMKKEVHMSKRGWTDYLISENFSIPIQKLFDSKHFTEYLFFSHRLILTAKTGTVSLKEKYLKPAQYFLVIYEKKHLNALAISDTEADFFQTQLLDSKASAPHERCIALFTSDGSLAQNGPTSLAFSENQLVALNKHTWFEGVVTDIGFVSCRLRNTQNFLKRAEKWKNLASLWKKIQSCQPHTEGLNIDVLDQLINTKKSS